jgi:hypothetical protein
MRRSVIPSVRRISRLAGMQPALARRERPPVPGDAESGMMVALEFDQVAFHVDQVRGRMAAASRPNGVPLAAPA